MSIQETPAADSLGVETMSSNILEYIDHFHETSKVKRTNLILMSSGTITSTFGEFSKETSFNVSAENNEDDDDDDETVVFLSGKSSKFFDSKSSVFSESLLKTDDEKLQKHQSKHTPTTSVKKAYSKKQCPPFIAREDKPFDKFSESLMKIIDEILECDENQQPKPVYAYVQTDLSIFKEHNSISIDNNQSNEIDNLVEKNHSGVQTNVTLFDTLLDKTEMCCQTSIVEEVSNQIESDRFDSKVLQNIIEKDVTLDETTSFDFQSDTEENVSEDLIITTNLLFQTIQQRKASLYKHQEQPFSNMEPRSEEPIIQSNSFLNISSKVSLDAAFSASKKSCHHRSQLRNMTKPLPSQRESTQTANIPKAHNLSQSKEQPSVRLEQIRKMQRRQQLIQNNPDMLRTINSIQSEVKSGRSRIQNRTDQNQVHRAKYNETIIQEAAKKVLEQISSFNQHQSGFNSKAHETLRNQTNLDFPIWPSSYLDDSVQREAELYLESVDADYRIANAKRNNEKYEYTATQSTGSFNSSTTMDSFKASRKFCLNSVSKNYTISESNSNKVVTISSSQSMQKNTFESNGSPHQVSSTQSTIPKTVEMLSSEQRNYNPHSDNSLMLKSTSSSIARQMESIEKRIQPERFASTSTTSGYGPIGAADQC